MTSLSSALEGEGGMPGIQSSLSSGDCVASCACGVAIIRWPSRPGWSTASLWPAALPRMAVRSSVLSRLPHPLDGGGEEERAAFVVRCAAAEEEAFVSQDRRKGKPLSFIRASMAVGLSSSSSLRKSVPSFVSLCEAGTTVARLFFASTSSFFVGGREEGRRGGGKEAGSVGKEEKGGDDSRGTSSSFSFFSVGRVEGGTTWEEIASPPRSTCMPWRSLVRSGFDRRSSHKKRCESGIAGGDGGASSASNRCGSTRGNRGEAFAMEEALSVLTGETGRDRALPFASSTVAE